VRLLTSFVLLATLAAAGPVDFGLAELNSAMAERKLRWRNQAELSLDPPETFRIEPYRVGGAHITGGDLRGLMYGLLEAAEQIHATGHFTKTTGSPAASLRGIRIVLNAGLERASPDFWHSYFQMLARNRFNRVHVVFPRLGPPYRLPRFLSRTAADYGIDFTLGIEGEITSEELVKVLAACPAIRGVALEEDSSAQGAVFAAIRQAGRRVSLDLDGATVEPGVLLAAVESGIPLLRPMAPWPPSFEIAPPLEPDHAESHADLYWAMGRLSYDPKSKLPKDADADEYRAAREIGLWIAAAQDSNLGGSDYVATAAEAARNRLEKIASAKITPPDIAERLDAAAAELSESSNADFRLLAQMAREQAEQQRAAVNLAPFANWTPPSKWTHTAPATAPSEQPLTLTLRIAQPKAVHAVRLHYRTLDPAAASRAIEMPAAAEVSFTIPAAEITGNWDMLYYFEILDAEGHGWFEPDPLTATPYWTVHIIAPHTGRN
jgi:hypothetical protein